MVMSLLNTPPAHLVADAIAAPDGAPASVTPLRNEQDLARALAPWQRVAERQRWVKPILLLTDLAVMWLCFLAGRVPAWIRDDMSFWAAMDVWWTDHGQLRIALFLALSLAIVLWCGAAKGHYTAARRKPWWDEARDVFLIVGLAAMTDALVLYLGKWQLSRLWTGVSWTLILLLLPLARLAVRQRLLRVGLLAQPYVLVGRPEDLPLAAAALASEPLMGYTPVAAVGPDAAPGQASVHPVKLGSRTLAPTPLTPGVRAFLSRPGPYQVVIVLGENQGPWLRDLTQELMLTRDDVIIIPALSGLPMLGMEVSHFFSHEVLLLRARNNLHRRAPQMLKRAFDIIGASLLLLLLSPVFALLAWKVSRDGGSAFFGHTRVGQNGRPFKCYKFRSMVMNAQEALQNLLTTNPAARAEWERDFKLRNDPRISPIGHFLRRTSLDELPQLWNVLIGDMSLVGPRPIVQQELQRYGSHAGHYLKVRPGMTGLWQVSGRSDTDYNTRVYFDSWYVKNWSLWYDIVILLRTVRVVVRQEGAV